MGDIAPLYEHRKNQICTFCLQNALIRKEIKAFKHRIPNSFQEFENFVKGLIDWNPSRDVLFTIWYKFWSMQQVVAVNKIPPATINYQDDDNELQNNEVPYSNNKNVSKKTKIKIEKISNEDNKYHLRSMGPILSMQPMNEQASTSYKRKAFPKGPQTKHGKKNKNIKNEPLEED